MGKIVILKTTGSSVSRMSQVQWRIEDPKRLTSSRCARLGHMLKVNLVNEPAV